MVPRFIGTDSPEYAEALQAAQGESSLSFFETFGKMFSLSLPDGLDADLLAQTMTEWTNFWMSPAIMAAIIFVVFAILFWDKTEALETEETAEADS